MDILPLNMRPPHDIASSWRGTQVSFGESNFKMKGKMTDLRLNNFNN
jgi:hypothetical protein